MKEDMSKIRMYLDSKNGTQHHLAIYIEEWTGE